MSEIERTCVIIKPDGCARRLEGAIIRKLLNGRRQLRIVGAKMLRLTNGAINDLLPKTRHWARKVGLRAIERFRRKGIHPERVFGTSDPFEVARIIRENNKKYFSMGPVFGLVLEGPDAIRTVREICGGTSPSAAQPGTIRGDYSEDDFDLANVERRPCLNVLHSSATPAEAKRDIRWLMRQQNRIVDAGISPVLIGWLRKQGKWA